MNMQSIIERLIFKAISEGTLKVRIYEREGETPAKAKLEARIGNALIVVSEIPLPEAAPPSLRVA